MTEAPPSPTIALPVWLLALGLLGGGTLVSAGGAVGGVRYGSRSVEEIRLGFQLEVAELRHDIERHAEGPPHSDVEDRLRRLEALTIKNDRRWDRLCIALRRDYPDLRCEEP